MLYDFSAGGIVQDDRGRIAVIQTRNLAGKLVWGLPKGHPKKAETPIETALRETNEETGLHVVAVVEVDPVAIDYSFTNKAGERVHKRVEFYLMRSEGGDITNHDHEVVQVMWMTLEETQSNLSYQNERELLLRVCV